VELLVLDVHDSIFEPTGVLVGRVEGGGGPVTYPAPLSVMRSSIWLAFEGKALTSSA
jgi:hypothetical protein